MLPGPLTALTVPLLNMSLHIPASPVALFSAQALTAANKAPIMSLLCRVPLHIIQPHTRAMFLTCNWKLDLMMLQFLEIRKPLSASRALFAVKVGFSPERVLSVW